MSQVCIGHCARMTRHWMVAQATRVRKELRELFRNGPPCFEKCYKTLIFSSVLTSCTIPCACHAKRRFNVQKIARTCGVLYILTSQCASWHNGVHFFDIATLKSGPNLMFLVFSLANVFRATTACTFSTSQLRKVVRTWGVFSSGQMAPRPPLSRAYFSTLRSHKSLEKHSELRLSYVFARLNLLACHSFSSLIFCLLLFSSVTLPISAFHLSILSEV